LSSFRLCRTRYELIETCGAVRLARGDNEEAPGLGRSAAV
jgi:hypothetical protein